MANTGKDYEVFVAQLQQALLNAEQITHQKNITVEVNKIIVDNCGINRQFDIYWEYELGGIIYKTVIECKDYSSKISVDKIDALIGKTKDIPDIKPVFATKVGYQSGAKIKADQNKINLLIVREQNDSDWVDDDGTPLVKKICVNMYMRMPAHIHKFEPIIDGTWLKENTSINIEEGMQFSGMNNEIFIENLNDGSNISLHELSSKLEAKDGKEYGVFTLKERFKNAFIHHNDLSLKLSGFNIEYSILKPIVNTIEIDGSKELLGVIEYLQKGTKSKIFRDGIIRKTEANNHIKP